MTIRNGGRGGIRTHGGFPHARFRVECLKPDSATLPSKQKKRRTRNVQHTTSNATVSRLGVQRWALDVERLSSGKPPASHAPPAVGKSILSLQRRARPRVPEKMLQFLACHR